MDATRLILIRHAHVRGTNANGDPLLCGWFDEPLSTLGRRQVEDLRKRLLNEPEPAAIYCSSLLRTRETAGALRPGMISRLYFTNSIREIHCGGLDGIPLKDVELQHPDLWQLNFLQSDENFRWPGGESYKHFRSRILRFVEKAATLHKGGCIWIFTHCGVITQLIHSIYGITPARWNGFRANHASITELVWEKNHKTVVRFSDIDLESIQKLRTPA
jgi:broad specificity phosphatase PhoE